MKRYKCTPVDDDDKQVTIIGYATVTSLTISINKDRLEIGVDLTKDEVYSLIKALQDARIAMEH